MYFNGFDSLEVTQDTRARLSARTRRDIGAWAWVRNHSPR